MATPNATPRQESCTEEIQSVEANTVYKKELDFIKQPPLEYFCPVSLELLLEPQQTKCCGNHLSQEAAKKLQEEGKPCPMCKSEEWSADLDKYHRRKVHQVRVRCRYEGSGCGWEGSMHEFERHIDSCVIRPWECEYCGLKCTYGEGVERHWPECHKFPEPCPNGCEVGSVERCGMEQHRSVCPLEPVACEMKEFGCSVVVPRRELATHMRESELQHLTTMTALNLRLTRQLQQDSAERDKKVEQLQQDTAALQAEMSAIVADTQTRIESRKCELMTYVRKVEDTIRCVELHRAGGTCVVCEMPLTKFPDQLLYTESFYSHHHGYKFKLGVDLLSDTCYREELETSKLLKREETRRMWQDLQKKRTEMSAEYRKEDKSELDKCFEDLEREFTEREKDFVEKEKARREKDEFGLYESSDEDKDFEKLLQKFRNKEKETKDKRKKELGDSKEYQSQRLKQMKEELDRDSKVIESLITTLRKYSYYPSSRRGVDASNIVRSTVCVFLHLMNCEYDDNLQWPVEVRVQLELLNQGGDHHHLLKTRNMTLTREMRGKDGEYVFKFLPKVMYKSIKVGGGSTNDQLLDENVKYLLASCLMFRIIITVC